MFEQPLQNALGLQLLQLLRIKEATKQRGNENTNQQMKYGYGTERESPVAAKEVPCQVVPLCASSRWRNSA